MRPVVTAAMAGKAGFSPGPTNFGLNGAGGGGGVGRPVVTAAMAGKAGFSPGPTNFGLNGAGGGGGVGESARPVPAPDPAPHGQAWSVSANMVRHRNSRRRESARPVPAPDPAPHGQAWSVSANMVRHRNSRRRTLAATVDVLHALIERVGNQGRGTPMPSCARICPTLAATVDVLHALIERVGNQGRGTPMPSCARICPTVWQGRTGAMAVPVGWAATVVGEGGFSVTAAPVTVWQGRTGAMAVPVGWAATVVGEGGFSVTAAPVGHRSERGGDDQGLRDRVSRPSPLHPSRSGA